MIGASSNNINSFQLTIGLIAKEFESIKEDLTKLDLQTIYKEQGLWDKVWSQLTTSRQDSSQLTEIRKRIERVAGIVLLANNILRLLPNLSEIADAIFPDVIRFVSLVDSIAEILNRKELFGETADSTQGKNVVEETIKVAGLFFNHLPIPNSDEKARSYVDSLRPLKNSDSKSYYKLLADLVEKFKIPIHKLSLTYLEYLELAPFLTYVEIDLSRMIRLDGGLITEIVKLAQNMRACVLTNVDVTLVFGAKYVIKRTPQIWEKLERFVVTGGNLSSVVLENFPNLKELSVEGANFEGKIEFKSISCLQKLSLNITPPYTYEIPQKVFSRIVSTVIDDGKSLDISQPYIFISYLRYVQSCKMIHEVNALVGKFPFSAELQEMTSSNIDLLINNFEDIKIVFSENSLRKFPTVADPLFRLLLLPLPLEEIVSLRPNQQNPLIQDGRSMKIKWLSDALTLVQELEREPLARMTWDQKTLLDSFCSSGIGQVWIRHNIISVMNCQAIFDFLISKESKKLTRLLCDCFVIKQEKISHKNRDNFKKLVHTRHGLKWARDPKTLADSAAREMIYRVDPLARIYFYCNNEKLKIWTDEYSLFDDALRLYYSQSPGLETLQTMLMFKNPDLRARVYLVLSAEIIEFFLTGVNDENKNECQRPFREFLGTDLGKRWLCGNTFTMLETNELFRKIVFDAHPNIKHRFRLFLRGSEITNFVIKNFEWLWNDLDYRKILLENHFNLFFAVPHRIPTTFSKEEFEAVARFFKSQRGKPYLNHNRQALLNHASLRLIIGIEDPQVFFSFFIDRGKSEKISVEEFNILEQFAKSVVGKRWVIDHKSKVQSHEDLRQLLWEADINAMIPFFLENAEIKPTDKEKKQLATLIQGRGPTVVQMITQPLKNISNPHLRKLVVRHVPAMLLTEVFFDSTVKLSEKEKALLLGYIKSPDGRTMIKLDVQKVLLNNKLRPLVFQAYPPTNSENYDLYPISIEKDESTLLFKIYPAMPLLDPDSILQAMLNNQPFDSISIIHYGSPAIDQSGLSKQFLAQLMQGLPKSRLIPFEVTDAGYLQPRDTGAKMSFDQEQALALLGRLFGMAINNRYPLGLIFSPQLIRALYLGSSPFETMEGKDPITRLLYINDTYDQMLPQVENTGWQDQLDPDKENHPYQLIKIVCQNPTREIAFKAAEKLNLVWDSDEIRSAILAEDLLKLQNLVLDTWFDEHKRYYDTLKFVALGMMETLPFEINGIQIAQWQDLERITVEDFSAALLGQLSADYIKESLQFEITGNIKELVIDERRGWFVEWIDAHANDQKALANFIHGLTGAPALADKITIRLTTNVAGIKSQTCSNTVNLHPDYPKEVLINDFNDYASGKFPTFDSL